jgi:hypothetical protein
MRPIWSWQSVRGFKMATLDHDLEEAARTLGVPILEVS